MNINEIISSGSEECSGCTACSSICPKQCITMEEDREGFLYPSVDKNICIDCGQCIKVCPFHNPYESHKPFNVCAAYNKNERVRMISSSGGVFTLIAEKVINEGGVVFGAKYTPDWQVEIVPAETVEGIADFRGSKYLQARMGNSLRQVKQLLCDGRKVLFSGTPCQVAGLRHYLKKDYNNLLTVDFVCHGVPSPKVWAKYLQEVLDAGKKAINDIKFRDKPNGWKKFNFTLKYNRDDKEYSLSSYNGSNHYMRAFLSDMILRPSCYNCQAKSGCSHSDITIADYWGISQIHPEIDDDKGTSLILIHTIKGKDALDFSQMECIESEYDKAFSFNPAIERSAIAHRHRFDFFNKLDATDYICNLIDKELKLSVCQQIRKRYYKLLSSCKSIIKAIRASAGGDCKRKKQA